MTDPEPISRKRVLYTVPGMAEVTVSRDQEYRGHDRSPLALDVYYPPGQRTTTLIPAVVFVTGFRDAGARKMLGGSFRQTGSYVSWAQLVAASGIAAVTYENREPASDALALLQHLREHGARLGIDAGRVAIWSCSGHVPAALAVLMFNPPGVRCAALLYGYMLDLDGRSDVAGAASKFGFTNPAAAKRVEDLPRELPLLVVRAGRDEMPGLNDAIDRFAAHALAANLPVTVLNHPPAPHAFDLYCDDAPSHHVVAHVLAFMRAHVTV